MLIKIAQCFRYSPLQRNCNYRVAKPFVIPIPFDMTVSENVSKNVSELDKFLIPDSVIPGFVYPLQSGVSKCLNQVLQNEKSQSTK